MFKLRAGTLRHKILIQRSVEVPSAMGANELVWSDLKVTKASVNPVTGVEWFMNENLVNSVDFSIVLRKTDLKPNDRIVFQARVFDIVHVLNNQERGVSFLLLVKERLGETFISTVEKLLTEAGEELLTEAGENLMTEQIR